MGPLARQDVIQVVQFEVPTHIYLQPPPLPLVGFDGERGKLGPKPSRRVNAVVQANLRQAVGHGKLKHGEL